MNPPVGGPRAAFPRSDAYGSTLHLVTLDGYAGNPDGGECPASSLAPLRALLHPVRADVRPPSNRSATPARPASGPPGLPITCGRRGRSRGSPPRRRSRPPSWNSGGGLPALPARKGRPMRRLCTRRRGRPTRRRDARSKRFWPGDDPGEGQSYMGLFPRPIGKRFSRARRPG